MKDLRARLNAHLGDRYEVVRELGAGGMATVFLARDTKHGREVALKVLRPEVANALGAERFLREIETVARLTHPHILPLHDSGEAGGLLYYVMPYVEGESLRDRLEREGALPIEDALQIARECAAGLAYAHDQGVLHRDIKPANILLSGGNAVLADFGIARALEEAAEGDALTRTGVSVGTVGYMSPEQTTGGGSVDARTDVYALGCVLYEMLAGEPAFRGSTAQAVIARQIGEGSPSVSVVRPSIPDAVESLLDRALAPNPADRLRSVRDFLEAVRAIGRPAGSRRSPSDGARASRGAHRVLNWRNALLGGVLGVLALGAWIAGHRILGADDAAPLESLAILPFDNLTGDPEQLYFVDGMTDALTAELSKIGSLKVISRTSAMRYRNTDKRLPEIARELGAEALIEGSIMREGDQVRITVQLIHGRDDEHIWSDTYQREIRSVLALQGEVSRAIAERVQGSLTPVEVGRLASGRTVEPAAYEEYLRGRYQWNKLTREGWQAAIGHFEQSIEIDSNYAPAHAMMSLAYSLLGYYASTPPAATPPGVLHRRALAAAERAVALDSSLAEAHASLALAKLSYEWDWSASDRASQEALRLNPNAPMALYARAFHLSFVGRHDEAITVAERAVELDPVAPWVNAALAMHYFMARRYDEAIEQTDGVLAVEPDYRDAAVWRTFSYAKKGMYTEAATWNERGLVRGWIKAWLLALEGRSDEARDVLEEIPPEWRVTPNGSFALAVVWGELGEADRAFALLEQAYQGRSPLMAMLKTDPRIDALRHDPRFDELLQRMDFQS